MDNRSWRAIWEGDSLIYEQWYHEWFRKLFNYGRRFTTDTALIEDTIQELFIDTWQRREKLLHLQNPSSYLLSAFRYSLLRKIKKAGRIQSEYFFSTDSLLMAGETDTTDERLHELKQVLATLTPRQREAIFLRFYEKLSYGEVADILGISVKATYKIMARALLALKDKLAWLIIYWI